MANEHEERQRMQENCPHQHIVWDGVGLARCDDCDKPLRYVSRDERIYRNRSHIMRPPSGS